MLMLVAAAILSALGLTIGPGLVALGQRHQPLSGTATTLALLPRQDLGVGIVAAVAASGMRSASRARYRAPPGTGQGVPSATSRLQSYATRLRDGPNPAERDG
jgi:hypothetical protein